MSTLFKNKILFGLVILLLIANIATIVIFWTGMQRGPHPPFQQPAEFLIKEVGLDNKQEKQYLSMVQKHRQQTNELREQVKIYKDSLFNLLATLQNNDSLKINITNKIALLNQQLDLLTFDHFKEVRTILTPAQQEKFDIIIKEVLRMMSGPPLRER